MNKKIYLTAVVISFLFILFMFIGGCSTDPIKSVKNNPAQMDILMNHIAHDDAFRAQMIDKLLSTGDRQKLAEQFVKEDDVAKMLLSKILDTESGKKDVINRIANRKEMMTKALEKSLTLFEYRGMLLGVFLKDEGMVEYMKSSEELKAALAE